VMDTTVSRRRLNTAQAAEYLGPDFSPRTLERWRWAGGGPIFIRVGRHVYYDTMDLDAYLVRKRRVSTTVPATAVI